MELERQGEAGLIEESGQPGCDARQVGVWLLVVISALLILGALMVHSAGASVDQDIRLGDLGQWSQWRKLWGYTSVKRVLFVPVVWFVLAVTSRLNYRRWVVNEKHFVWSPVLGLLLVSVALLVLVLVPGIGVEKNQSRRWLSLAGGMQFQPSELAKWTTVMFLGAYCWWRGERMRQFGRGCLPALAVLLVVVGLIGVEDFGTAALVGAVGAMVLLAGGVRWWHLGTLIPVAAVAFYVLVYSSAYRWQRVLAYWYGSSGPEPSASAYQGQQSIMAIGSGGLWGKGLGNGTIKMGWVPEDTTDFVFAVIGEELGFVGCALVVGLFAAFLVCSGVLISRSRDRLGRLLVVAIAGTIGSQAVMNLMVVSGLAPTKGIALPFVSAGGSGLVLTALAAGVLVNIAQRSGRGT